MSYAELELSRVEYLVSLSISFLAILCEKTRYNLRTVRSVLIIYNLTNDCTIISNTIITHNMLLHVSTCHPQGAHCALLKLHTDFLVLVK